MGWCRAAIDAAVDVDAVPDVAAPQVDAGVDAMVLPCTTASFACTTGATTFMCGTGCFARCNAVVDATTAKSRCTAWSGKLGEIIDADTNSCIRAQIDQTTWIGLTRSANAWTWNNTTAVGYSHWHVGEPNGGSAESCGVIAVDGTWDDVACGSPGAFVCQR